MFLENNYVSSSKLIKSNIFVQTCNKLNRLLKDKRSFAHQHIFSSSISGNNMKNLFCKNKEKEDDIISLDLFPLTSSSTMVNTDESTQNHTDDYRGVAITKEEANTKTASMTIFYGGRVLVLDDLPEDKAREIMSLASHGVIQTQTRTQTQTQRSTHTVMDNKATTIEQPSHGHVLLDQSDSSSDLLPIARRVSLHRFMEKRKNRIAASAPYPSQSTPRENIDEMGQRLEKEVELKLFE